MGADLAFPARMLLCPRAEVIYLLLYSVSHTAVTALHLQADAYCQAWRYCGKVASLSA